MNQDTINLIENIKGVFADLDDGGLTEGEALAQIGEIIGRFEEEQELKGGHA